MQRVKADICNRRLFNCVFAVESRGCFNFTAAYERLFHRIPNHIITIKHQRNIPGLTVEECARRCLQEMTFNCRGFDYETRRRNCWLTNKSLQETDGLKRRSNTDFYERKSSNNMFIIILDPLFLSLSLCIHFSY